MKFKIAAFLIMWIILPDVVCAQKYLSTDSNEITKEWEEYKFSSEKTLRDNLKDVVEMSFMNSVLDMESTQQMFDNHEMLTVFVLMDSSFSELDKEEKEALLQNREEIQTMMQKLSIPGRIDKNSLVQAVKKHGVANLGTINGENLQIIQEANELFLVAKTGRKSKIEYFDFYYKNGLFHLINGSIFLEKE